MRATSREFLRNSSLSPDQAPDDMLPDYLSKQSSELRCKRLFFESTACAKNRRLFPIYRYDAQLVHHGSGVALLHGAGESRRALRTKRDCAANGRLDFAIFVECSHIRRMGRPITVDHCDGLRFEWHGVQRHGFSDMVRPQGQRARTCPYCCVNDRRLLHQLCQLSIPRGLGQRLARLADRHGDS